MTMHVNHKQSPERHPTNNKFVTTQIQWIPQDFRITGNVTYTSGTDF